METTMDPNIIRRGQPVEFTRDHVLHYPDGSGEFGIATEDAHIDRGVMVELATGEIFRAVHIHAYAWAGWVPDDLEPILEKYSLYEFDEFDEFDESSYF